MPTRKDATSKLAVRTREKPCFRTFHQPAPSRRWPEHLWHQAQDLGVWGFNFLGAELPGKGHSRGRINLERLLAPWLPPTLVSGWPWKECYLLCYWDLLLFQPARWMLSMSNSLHTILLQKTTKVVLASHSQAQVHSFYSYICENCNSLMTVVHSKIS